MKYQARPFNSELSPWPADSLLHAHYHDRSSSEPTTVSVAEAVAAVTGKRIDELRPLAELVDPEILNRFQPRSDRPNVPCSVSFVYEEHPITVTHTGEIQIYATDATDRV